MKHHRHHSCAQNHAYYRTTKCVQIERTVCLRYNDAYYWCILYRTEVRGVDWPRARKMNSKRWWRARALYSILRKTNALLIWKRFERIAGARLVLESQHRRRVGRHWTNQWSGRVHKRKHKRKNINKSLRRDTDTHTQAQRLCWVNISEETLERV